MKKIIAIIIYLLGWIYPMSTNVVSILDIKTKLSGPYDYGNDTILFYMFSSFVFSAITFGIYFYYMETRFDTGFKLYFTFVNIPLYFLSVYCGCYSDDYPWIAIIALVVEALMILCTVFVTLKKTKEKEYG